MSTDSVSSWENVFARREIAPPLPKRLLQTFGEWRRRMRSRRELAGLSDLELKDIGYPAAAEAEKQKPFWRS